MTSFLCQPNNTVQRKPKKEIQGPKTLDDEGNTYVSSRMAPRVGKLVLNSGETASRQRGLQSADEGSIDYSIRSSVLKH
jgi:hypothetical protein